MQEMSSYEVWPSGQGMDANETDGNKHKRVANTLRMRAWVKGGVIYEFGETYYLTIGVLLADGTNTC